MSRAELHLAVADATGEALATIDRLGFRLLTGDSLDEPCEDQPLLVLDCPCCGKPIVLSDGDPENLPAVAECGRCEAVFDYREDEVYAADLDDLELPMSRTYAPAA